MRLASHHLKIETGRWSRLPREQRLCQCGQVQTEEHVILNCVLLNNARENSDLNFTNLRTISEFFEYDSFITAKFCKDVFDFFKV